MITKIISGGQTGADRGGLEAALYCKIPLGGYCPKGRKAEDGCIPSKYPLKETDSPNYLVRTEANVVDSDATLVFVWGEPTGGTKRTIEFARKHERSCHVADLKGIPSKAVIDHIVRWLGGEIEEEEYPPPAQNIALNVAGPRESKIPGLEDAVAAIMVGVLQRVNPALNKLYPLLVKTPL